MHEFKYIGGRLYCENVPVKKIVKETGTPVFIYSQKTLLDHYRKLDKAFGSVPHIICYSVKSNSNLAVCRALTEAGAGLDIVSGGELYRAKRIKADPKKIVFAGVGKTDEEIRDALKAGILFFTVESVPELIHINKIAKLLRKKAPFALRINPQVDPHTHKYIATGQKGTKFGIDIPMSRWIYNQRHKFPHTIPLGIQMHIGSQITKPRAYVNAIKRILPLIKELKTKIPSIKYIDIGGGFGIVYKNEKPATAGEFARITLPAIKGLGLTIILEPGRFIAGNSGILAVSVLYVKSQGDKNFIITDGGMNDLLRPSLYNAYHRVIPAEKRRRRKITADIVGPVCESGDFFALGRRIEEPKEGEILAVMGAGAYGFSMSSNYNSRPRAAEVLVEGAGFRLIRKRESRRELTKNEIC